MNCWGSCRARATRRSRGAFVRAMGAVPAYGRSRAQIGLAYEVLRDPARRRAYDDSLGLRPEPKPIDAPRAVTFRGSAHFNGSAVVDAQPTAGRPPAPEPRHPPEDLREPRPEPEAMLGPTPEPEAMLEPEPESFVAAPFAPDIAAPHATRADPAVNGESQAEGFDWRRPLLGIGGVVLAAAAIGAWAGMQAGSDAEAQTRAQAVTVPVPRAAPTVAIAPDPMVQAQPRRRVRAPALRRAVARAAPVAAEAEPPAAADPAPGESAAPIRWRPRLLRLRPPRPPCRCPMRRLRTPSRASATPAAGSPRPARREGLERSR